jgi:hypothetical protein
MKHNTEKYKAFIQKESYISINNDERKTRFLTELNIKEQKVLQVLKLLK